MRKTDWRKEGETWDQAAQRNLSKLAEEKTDKGRSNRLLKIAECFENDNNWAKAAKYFEVIRAFRNQNSYAERF